MAKKHNASEAEMDITVWEWVTSAPLYQPTCASCHPGGGPMEFDRDGERYDERLAENPDLRDSLDGDYFGSHWEKSGVLEADCMICHLPGYNFEIRTEQLKEWNLAWAATAASGFGIVEGSVREAVENGTGTMPKVIYNRRLFNEDGKIVININPSVNDENCMQCHGPSDMKKRGFSWNDPLNPDVHNQQGIHCVDCHPADLSHNIAKGNSITETVRDDLDNTMRTCEDCHAVGYLGASIPKHLNFPPSHIEEIACETCHIPQKHRAAGAFLDVTHGDLHWDIIGDKESWGEPADWYPAYTRYNGKIRPINPVFAIWWGNREADGKVYPLFAKELARAWELCGDRVADDNGDGYKEINTRQEIEAGLRAMQEALKESGRFKQIQPLFVKGDKVWEIGQDSILTGHWDPICEGEGFSVSHNVAPARMALGAGGCIDCHGFTGKFFQRTHIVDPYDENGEPVIEPVRKTVGISDFSYFLFVFYHSLVRPHIGILLIIVFFLTTLHFTRFGPHDFSGVPIKSRDDDYERIQRFRFFERFVHLVVLMAFIFLGLTGLAFMFSGGSFLDLFFGNTVTPRIWHQWLGIVFAVGVFFMFIFWRRDAVLAPSDKEWLRKLGGYLGAHEPVPADRFNAGQKIYFWTVVFGGIILFITGLILIFRKSLPDDLVFIAVCFHDLAALFGVAGVLSHVYLSTGANPGTVQAIFVGKVTKLWARLHHPLWYEKITGRPAANEKDSDER